MVMPYKLNIKLCDTCPHLDFCQEFPYLPLGNHPAHRCPDGVIEKVFPWETPGRSYRRATGLHADKIARGDDELYAMYNRPGHSSYKCKWCILCMFKRKKTRISKGSRYLLCRSCAGRYFNPWKKRNKDTIAEKKGQPIYTFLVKLHGS